MKMKKIVSYSLFSVLSVSSAIAYAATPVSIPAELQFRGELTVPGCTIGFVNGNEVQFGRLSTEEIESNGSPVEDISIALSNCPLGSAPKLKFNGTKDIVDEELFAVNGVTGIAVEVLNRADATSGVRVKRATLTDPISMASTTSGNFPFGLRVVKSTQLEDNSTTPPKPAIVMSTAGTFNGLITVTAEY
ncbi:fimbrial protein [Aeromonas salmonicida]